MKITIDLPDELFRKAEALAASRGQTLEQLIVQLLRREVGDFTESETSAGRNRTDQCQR